MSVLLIKYGIIKISIPLNVLALLAETLTNIIKNSEVSTLRNG